MFGMTHNGARDEALTTSRLSCVMISNSSASTEA